MWLPFIGSDARMSFLRCRWISPPKTARVAFLSQPDAESVTLDSKSETEEQSELYRGHHRK